MLPNLPPALGATQAGFPGPSGLVVSLPSAIRAPGAGTPNFGGGGAFRGATPNTAGPSDGASAAAHSFPSNATPLLSRVAEMVRDCALAPYNVGDS